MHLMSLFKNLVIKTWLVLGFLDFIETPICVAGKGQRDIAIIELVIQKDQ